MMISYLRRKPVPTRNIHCCESPDRRWRTFINWLFDSLTPGVPVVSTVEIGSLKSPAFIWRSVVAVIAISILLMLGSVQSVLASSWESRNHTVGYNSILLEWGTDGGTGKWGLCLKEAGAWEGKCDNNPFKIKPDVEFSSSGTYSADGKETICTVHSNQTNVLCYVKDLDNGKEYKFALYYRHKIYGPFGVYLGKGWRKVNSSFKAWIDGQQPDGHITASKSSICKGDSVKLTFKVEGTKSPYDFKYKDEITGQVFDISSTGHTEKIHYPNTTTTFSLISVMDGVKSTSENSLSNEKVTVVVHDLPRVSLILKPSETCSGYEPIKLKGSINDGPPSDDGEFSGLGVEGGFFNPKTAGVGQHPITYTYTDVNGCTDSDTKYAHVKESPSIVGFKSNTNDGEKNVVSPVSTFGFPYDLPNRLVLQNGNLTSTVNNNFEWYEGNHNGFSGTPITQADNEAAKYWVKYTDPNNQCSTLDSLKVYDKGGNLISIGAYCIAGVANGEPYSWKIVDNGTELAKCLTASGTASGGTATQLADSFVKSINGVANYGCSPPVGGVSAVIFGFSQQCFTITPNTAKLYVGIVDEKPTCSPDDPVNATNGCAYNPVIKKVELSCALPPQDIVASFSLNEEDDNYVNNPISVQGKIGNAVSLNGSNYVEIPHDAKQNFGENDFSISTWIKTGQVGGFGAILNKEYLNPSTGNTQGYLVSLDKGKLGIQLADGNGSWICSERANASCTTYSSGTFIADDEWHLITIAVDRDNPEGGKFYVDGQQVKTFNPTFRSGSLNTDEPLKIGINPFGGIVGEVDEVILYKRALTAEEVYLLYKNDSAGICKIDGANSQTSLIINGGFEEPSLSNGDWQHLSSKQVPGWTLSSGPAIEIQNHVTRTPYEGEQHAELDSSAPYAIYQDISTTPNQGYTLTFVAAARPYTNFSGNKFEVLWDGKRIDVIQGINDDWKEYSYNVTASGNTTRLEFKELAANVHLDDISLLKSSNTTIFTEVAQSYGVAEYESNFAAVWLDYDNDGNLDLLTVPTWGPSIDNEVVLYRNDGNSFTDVASAVGLTGHNLSSNISVGDYDNDGDVDLLIGNRLYRNDINTNGLFTFVETPYGGTFVDYDLDGDLDFFHKGWGSPGKLFQNNGGTFTEIVGALGLDQESRHIRSINWADYDSDGDMDLLLMNGRSERPTLFRNEINTTGQFTDATSDMGLINAGSGYTEGAAWGDYDNDSDLDLYIANYGGANHLYRNDGNVFTQVTTQLGVASQRGFHANWEDYDNDGDLDLYVIMLSSYPNKLYRNEISEGNGFVETGEMADIQIGSGGSWGDFDADGDLDYFLVGAVGRNKATNRFYKSNASENGNHWLQLNLIGTVSNRSAIGATIYIKTGNSVQMRHIASYNGFSAQNTFPVTFGLGQHATADTITIKWPSGIEQVLENVAVDQRLTIEEPFTSTIGLTVTKTGEGEISSADNTINCGATCQADYEVDSTVTLTATPATGSTFTGWSGDCSGTSTTTTVTMDTVKTCTATFELIAITSVKLVAITSPSPVCKGEEFDVTFQVVTEESQPVDGIQVYLNFDPDKMQINSIANSGVLDLTLMEEFDNAAGYINFAAGSWENAPPTGNFELVTINFTALEESEETLLQVDPNQSSSTFGGGYIPQEADDTPVAIEDCTQLGCKVALEGRASPPDASWVTELKIYADGNTYTINTDNEGHCQLPKELSEGNYSLCVKNSHTLANRIGPPVAVNSDGIIDFGSLLEGDVNDDNKVFMDDFTLLLQSKGKCQNEASYNANANLNADNCVNTDDALLLKANYFKPKGDEEPSICEWDNSVPPTLVRKKVRDGGGTVTLRTAPIPSGLIAGTLFDVVVQVEVNKQLAEGVAAYLNFDPAQLQVNHLTVGNTFDFVLQNEFDNTQGHINFAAGVWDNEVPKGLFTLVTINMTLLQVGGEETLSFNTTAPRQTEAASGGQSVISEQGGEVVIIAPASCQLYAVHDEKLNDSQFFTMSFDDLTISELGPMYEGHDIESLAIHPKTNMIYAASGDDVTNGKPGHFYRVDGENGDLFPVGSTGFNEIGDLAFSSDGTLYAWAKGDGLITIDDFGTSGTSGTLSSTLVLPYKKPLIEGLTLKKNEGKVFFGAVGTDLWQFNMDTNILEVLCPNELLGKTEALEITPEGLLLVGTHKVPFGLHAFDIQTCQVIEAETLSNKFNDVEGIALPVAACSICGDGIIQPNEQCDDSNTVSGDGCSDVCLTE